MFKIKEGEDSNRRKIYHIFRGLKSEPGKKIGKRAYL